MSGSTGTQGASKELLAAPRCELVENDDAYPPLLRDLPHPPHRLYVLGNPAVLAGDAVSIVGARKATPYGLACARLAASCATALGLTVVSGAAIGCDQAAQRETLRRGGKTVAVLGCGADVVYPSDAGDMLEETVRCGGAVVSLQPWGSAPQRWAFIERNAVIAGLSRALVICEAGMPSGTFSTAQSASDAGREVLVFPGSFFSSNSVGSNYIIASDANAMPLWDRACLEVAFSRIYARLRPGEPARAGRASARGAASQGGDEAVDDVEQQVFRALQASPTSPGRLASSLAVRLPDMLRTLGRLEAHGVATRLPDGRYSLTDEAYRSYAAGT